jgi:hypothetical protein
MTDILWMFGKIVGVLILIRIIAYVVGKWISTFRNLQ